VFSVTVFTALPTVDVPLIPGSRPRRLAAISHQPPTVPTTVSGLPPNGRWSSLYSPWTERTENTAPNRSSIVAWRHYWHGPRMKTLQTVAPLLSDIQLLPSNDCFSCSTNLALSKYATVHFNTAFQLSPKFSGTPSLKMLRSKFRVFICLRCAPCNFPWTNYPKYSVFANR
jgi:hypothetical protein